MKLNKLFALASAAAVTLSMAGCRGVPVKIIDFIPGNMGGTVLPVMETDTGYYTSGQNLELSLQYYDTATQKSIYLCSKPECVHDGSEYCTATFGDMYISSSYEYVIKSEDGIESIFSRIENALSCPVKDIIDGNVNWTEAFSFAEMHQDRINDVLEHIEQMEEENAGA